MDHCLVTTTIKSFSGRSKKNPFDIFFLKNAKKIVPLGNKLLWSDPNAWWSSVEWKKKTFIMLVIYANCLQERLRIDKCYFKVMLDPARCQSQPPVLKPLEFFSLLRASHVAKLRRPGDEKRHFVESTAPKNLSVIANTHICVALLLWKTIRNGAVEQRRGRVESKPEL